MNSAQLVGAFYPTLLDWSKTALEREISVHHTEESGKTRLRFGVWGLGIGFRGTVRGFKFGEPALDTKASKADFAIDRLQKLFPTGPCARTADNLTLDVSVWTTSYWL